MMCRGVSLLFLVVWACGLAPWAFSEEPTGLIVEAVARDSLAAKAGVEVGDRLLSYDGNPLLSPAALRAVEENTFGKQEIALGLQREDNSLTLSVPLGRLGVAVRPHLRAEVLRLHEEGEAALGADRADEAVAKFRAAAQVPGDKGAAGWLYSRVGKIYEGQGQWAEAAEAHAAAWALLKGSPDAAARSRTVAALGLCSQELHDLPAAQRWYEQARQLDAAAGYEMWTAEDLISQGVVADEQGDLEAAQGYFSDALALFERLAPDSVDVAATLHSLGLVARERGDLEAAQEYLTRAVAIKERLMRESLDAARDLDKLGPARALALLVRVAVEGMDLASTLNDLGTVAFARGDLQAAQEHYDLALPLFERLEPDSPEVGKILSNLGVVAHRRGDLQAAQEHYGRVLALFERLKPDSLDVAGALNNLGLLADERGDLEAAQEYYARALALSERLDPGSLAVASSLGNLGRVAGRRGDLEAAQEYYTRGLVLFQRVAPDSLEVGKILSMLGLVAHCRGDHEAARQYLARGLAIKEQLAPDSLEVADSLNNVGRAAFEHGDLQAAHDYLARALAIKERLAPDSLDLAITLNGLGHLALLEHRVSDGLSFLARGVEIVESQRRHIASPEARALLMAQATDIYAVLVRAHLASKDLPTAFATVERARARSLVELLSERRLDFQADAPAELLAKQDELEQKRAAAYRQLTRLDPHKDDKRIEELRGELTQYAVQQRELEQQIRRASPKYADLQYPAPLDVKGAEEALGGGTLLLTYCVDEEETYLFALTGDGGPVPSSAGPRLPAAQPEQEGLWLFRLPVKKVDLREQVKAFRTALIAEGKARREAGRAELAGVDERLISDPKGARTRGKELYDLLVRPAQGLVEQAERVLICPDVILSGVPFAALVAEDKADKVRYFADLKPLHTIVSMTVYDELRQQRQPPGPRTAQQSMLVAFGDPDYAPGGADRNRGDQARGDRLRLAALTPLPGTREEVEAIKELYGPRARKFLGPKATETAAKQESGRARILHFACHGLLDDVDPLASGLALTPTETDDGLLRAWEIFEGVRLNADLVVLSACETGLGEQTKHEGVIGLTRALQYAGARSVVVSLWSVADESTAALMTAFYRELRQGTSKDVALQRAMAELRKNPKWEHPFHWAPFVLVGHWQ